MRTWLGDPRAFDAAFVTPPGRAHLLQTICRAYESLGMRAASVWVWRQRPAVVGGVPPA